MDKRHTFEGLPQARRHDVMIRAGRRGNGKNNFSIPISHLRTPMYALATLNRTVKPRIIKTASKVELLKRTMKHD